MKTPLIPVLLFLGFFAHNVLAIPPSWLRSSSQSSTLRCGSKVINIGDLEIDVREKCGEPSSWQQRYGISGQELRDPLNTLESNYYEQVIIDEWIYNFGPHRLKQYLRFENGILVEIRTLDQYGH